MMAERTRCALMHFTHLLQLELVLTLTSVIKLVLLLVRPVPY